MRGWRKQEPLDAPMVQEVARAATSGASRAELAQVALTYLLANTEADRIGVWIETRETPASRSQGSEGFRGVTADHDGGETPSEWDRMSPEAPLPADVLTSGKSVEQNFDDSPDQPILGALVGMQRTLWVPVENKGRLRGVLLAAMRKKNSAEPRRLLEQVAAELALALEWEDERRRARERTEDLAAVQKLLGELTSGGPVDALLAKVVASCTESSPEGDGIGAVFAVLRACEGEWRDTASEGAAPPWRMWRGGDEGWSHAMESEPLAAIFRRAREAHGTIASIPSVRWSSNEVARIIAIPLEAGGKTLGVLAAGFRNGGASVAASERLEVRASLATAALHLRKCHNIAALAVRLRETVRRLSQDWEARHRPEPKRSLTPGVVRQRTAH